MDPQEATTPAGAVMATGTSYQTVKSLEISSSTGQAPLATAAGVKHLLAQYPQLTSLVIYESREHAAMLRGLAACMDAGATEPGGYLSFLEHLELTFPTDQRGALAGLSRETRDTLEEGLTRGLAVLEEALAATVLRGGLVHLQALRFRPPTYKFHEGAQQRLVDALAAGMCPMLQTIDINGSVTAMFRMCEARRAFTICRGLKKLPFWFHDLKSEARMGGRAIARRLLASSLEEYNTRSETTWR